MAHPTEKKIIGTVGLVIMGKILALKKLKFRPSRPSEFIQSIDFNSYGSVLTKKNLAFLLPPTPFLHFHTPSVGIYAFNKPLFAMSKSFTYH